jgi:predicted acyltransferase
MDKSLNASPVIQGRLTSLDFFRGFTMFMLVGEATGLYAALGSPALQGSWLGWLGMQLDHHPWNGLRPWDLIQPFFMFIVGVAMPFSFGLRWERGESWAKSFSHALRRSALLLLFGGGLYCIGSGRLGLGLWNVLAQLSVTYLVAFLLMRKPARTQIVVTICLLLATELLYRFWPVAGFDQPFTPDKNFGSWVDLLLMGKLSGGHWVVVNALPTTAHTMWGVLAGQLLRSHRDSFQKIKILAGTGLLGVVIGYAMNPWTPIIKRICTSSFVIVSGGWCLLALVFSYWLIDVKGFKKWTLFFNIVGMNSLLIYMFTNTGGGEWFHSLARPFTMGLMGWAGEFNARIFTGLVVWGMLWSLCYGFYKKKIFLKM